jgi:hypothetical protein
MARKSDDELDPNDPMTVMARLADAIERLGQKDANTPGAQELMLRLSTALERVSEAQMKGSELIASETRKAHRPSNSVVPEVSVFNRRGTMLDPDEPGPHKPKLRCLMLLPWIAEWESLTREEVELLNLLRPGEYSLKRIDNSKVRVTITMDFKVDGNTPSRLVLTHDTAFNNDNFRLIPPLSDMLRQVLKQHDPEIRQWAAEVLSDEEEEALIEAGELSISV